MDVEKAILEILRSVGVYEQAREKINTDQELVDLFCNRFDELVRLVSE